MGIEYLGPLWKEALPGEIGGVLVPAGPGCRDIRAPRSDRQCAAACLKRRASSLPAHFTAPSVSPAMKCFCIRKNMATGGSAATIEPALMR